MAKQSPQQLYKTIKKLYLDQKLYKQLVDTGIKITEDKFNISNQVLILQDIYKDLING